MISPNAGMESVAYKIEKAKTWLECQENGVYLGSELDLKDGFIHLSTISQAQKTLDLYFQNIDDLIIAEVDLESFGENLKWEKSRGGDLFPHLYCALSLEKVTATYDIEYINGQPFLPKQIAKL